MDKNCKKNNCCCDTDGDFIQEKVSDAYLRLIDEKQELDDRIMKLKAFLDSFDEYDKLVLKVGSNQAADALYEQLDVMVRYSSLLNTRITLWKD